MRLFPEEILNKINTARRSVSHHRRPRRSIYDDESPKTENKSPPLWMITRSPSRVSDQVSLHSAVPSPAAHNINPPALSISGSIDRDSSRPRGTYGLVGRSTPVPGPRSTSAMSHISFRSLRSINSRIKVRMQSFGQAIEPRKPKVELDWSSLRAEYELHLARGSIIERCLVEVDLGPGVSDRGRWWIDTVWTLADRLSPPLPAVLAQYSASGLLPLLYPLRHTLHSLAIQLPYDHKREQTGQMDKFEQLTKTLRRAMWYAGLIEQVIEQVSQAGLVKFELVGLARFDEAEAENSTELEQIQKISGWSGEIRGRTGSGNAWRGSIKL